MKQGRAEAYYREEHAQDRAVITVEDVDNFVDSLLNGPDSENLAELHSIDRPLLASGFPDHEFLVGVNKELQVGVLGFMDETGNLVSLGRAAKQGNAAYYMVGNEREFPGRSEISIALVRQAVMEFLTSAGQRPTCIEWQEPEVW
ncbi:Imm1 family immunity protein [Streptomyces sp. NPDC056337]|uniref:Imm1 family immunity protein n=1 Tax=Streptomyces sp. NPDC056337 TaxID=3345787 RepID=UPI0035D7F98E